MKLFITLSNVLSMFSYVIVVRKGNQISYVSLNRAERIRPSQDLSKALKFDSEREATNYAEQTAHSTQLRTLFEEYCVVRVTRTNKLNNQPTNWKPL